MTGSEFDRKALSRRMRQASYEAGFRTTRALAQAWGRHEQTVGNWMSGLREPRAVELRRFCEVTGASADWLLGLSDSKAVSGTRGRGMLPEPGGGANGAPRAARRGLDAVLIG